MAKKPTRVKSKPKTKSQCSSIDLGALQGEFETARKRQLTAGRALERALDENSLANTAFHQAEAKLKEATRTVIG